MSSNLISIVSDILHHPGKVFPDVLLIVLLATAGLILLHLVVALIGSKPTRPRRRWNWWERLVYLGALVSVTTLGFTAFYPVLTLGHMRHWWLFAHMFGAGAMVAVLPLIAITWAGPNRFEVRAESDEEETYAPRFFWLTKLNFWLFLASGLIVALTMMLSMLPVFGTEGQHALLDIHRYAGLMAVVTLVLHLYGVLLQRARIR